MKVTEYTVSDANGETDGSTKGTIAGVPGNPFAFYVPNPQFDRGKGVGNTNIPCLTVQMVMPLGGRDSGLFRFPRVGEKVLVVSDENAHYLMGYLPTYTGNSQDFQTDGMFQDDGQGEVFRYQQTGKKDDAITADTPNQERYSEIGFYSRKTQWGSTNSQYKGMPDVPERAGTDTDDNYSTKLVTAGFPKKDEKESSADHVKRIEQEMKAAKIPVIDQINIHSTGDIHESAENYHRMKAKRIEILSNVQESDFSKELSGDNRPFGDKGANISELLQGDIHIRGKRRIVLKAGSEIRIEVGRSSIVISDAGIILTSRKTHSDIHNSLDTVLSVMPRDGITMFGQHLKLGAAYDWAILENMGSSIKGTAGIMRMEGKDIKASTISGLSYITNFITQTLAFADNLASMSVGTHDSDDIQDSGLPAYAGLGVGGAGILTNVALGLVSPSLGDDTDSDSKIVKFAALALQQLGVVIGAIETIYIDPEDQKSKDALALAGIIAEWGCLIPIFAAICASTQLLRLLDADFIHLGNNGKLTMLGMDIESFSRSAKFINSPLVLTEPPEPPKEKKGNLDKMVEFIKAHKKLFIGLGIGVGVAGSGSGVGSVATLGRMTSLTEEKERLLGELNAL